MATKVKAARTARRKIIYKSGPDGRAIKLNLKLKADEQPMQADCKAARIAEFEAQDKRIDGQPTILVSGVADGRPTADELACAARDSVTRMPESVHVPGQGGLKAEDVTVRVMGQFVVKLSSTYCRKHAQTLIGCQNEISNVMRKRAELQEELNTLDAAIKECRADLMQCSARLSDRLGEELAELSISRSEADAAASFVIPTQSELARNGIVVVKDVLEPGKFIATFMEGQHG